jgi:hypothetical protein
VPAPAGGEAKPRSIRALLESRKVSRAAKAAALRPEVLAGIVENGQAEGVPAGVATTLQGAFKRFAGEAKGREEADAQFLAEFDALPLATQYRVAPQLQTGDAYQTMRTQQTGGAVQPSPAQPDMAPAPAAPLPAAQTAQVAESPQPAAEQPVTALAAPPATVETPAPVEQPAAEATAAPEPAPAPARQRAASDEFRRSFAMRLRERGTVGMAPRILVQPAGVVDAVAGEGAAATFDPLTGMIFAREGASPQAAADAVAGMGTMQRMDLAGKTVDVDGQAEDAGEIADQYAKLLRELDRIRSCLKG